MAGQGGSQVARIDGGTYHRLSLGDGLGKGQAEPSPQGQAADRGQHQLTAMTSQLVPGPQAWIKARRQ